MTAITAPVPATTSSSSVRSEIARSRSLADQIRRGIDQADDAKPVGIETW